MAGASPTPEQVHAGQAVYTRGTLPLYDLVVIGVSNRFFWRCPSSMLRAHYERHLTDNHLDVGVGTGYFLDRCRFPSTAPRVALMDLNDDALAYAADRIARYRPETYRQDVLQPISAAIAPFDSIAMNYLLHCVPGAIGAKAVIFDHIASLAAPGATVFGSTLLQGGVPRNPAAVALMRLYNRRGIFSNAEDDLVGLCRSLEARFDEVTVKVVGCAALFAGRRRR